ncbi:hypothetical protein [Methylobacterium variabile]|jgi:hypothetical protein|uniref:hypothetical protein n=1 Tax=Methylobacterium variabile TaxID=298794 RepID=UPI00069E5347|nr:hypothetical protein [Methylobacterium variabile]
MSLTRAILTAAAGTVALLAPAGPAGAQGTEQQRLACMTDAMTLCAGDVPNTRRIELCLRRNYARISTPCQGVLDAARTAAASPDTMGAARYGR